jgi:hypothetical protein
MHIALTVAAGWLCSAIKSPLMALHCRQKDDAKSDYMKMHIAIELGHSDA